MQNASLFSGENIIILPSADLAQILGVPMVHKQWYMIMLRNHHTDRHGSRVISTAIVA